MTETFRASDGARIEVHDNNSRIDIKCTGSSGEQHFLSVKETQAAREFFQHERDEELGRWRWPENPDYVVYPVIQSAHEMAFGQNLSVMVFHEPTGVLKGYCREEDQGGDLTREYPGAARAYFKAHPERKARPWSEARFITWRNGAYLPQTAQRDLGGMNLGWWYGTGVGDEAWHSEDALAEIIGDADVTVLVTEDAS